MKCEMANCARNHIHIPVFGYERESGKTINVVRGGRRAYIWMSGDGGKHCAFNIGGETTLRMLARAILKEIGPAKPKRKR